MSGFNINRDQCTLFVMCHPDDEIAIAVTIHRLVQAGAEVHLAWTHSTKTRADESRAVAQFLGIPESHLTFLNGRDGDMVDDIEVLRPQLQEVIDRIHPDRIITVAFEQGHIDHDATNLLVNLCFAGPVYEFPMYTTYLTRMPVLNRFADPTGEEVTQLTPEESALKKKVAQSYPSQTIWRNVVWYERANRWKGRPVSLAATERLRLQTHRDFLTPNLPSPLRERVIQTPTWKRWEAAMRDLKITSL